MRGPEARALHERVGVHKRSQLLGALAALLGAGFEDAQVDGLVDDVALKHGVQALHGLVGLELLQAGLGGLVAHHDALRRPHALHAVHHHDFGLLCLGLTQLLQRAGALEQVAHGRAVEHRCARGLQLVGAGIHVFHQGRLAAEVEDGEQYLAARLHALEQLGGAHRRGAVVHLHLRGMVLVGVAQVTLHVLLVGHVLALDVGILEQVGVDRLELHGSLLIFMQRYAYMRQSFAIPAAFSQALAGLCHVPKRSSPGWPPRGACASC